MYEELTDKHQLRYTCPTCGGEDIHFDGMLNWNEDTQQFDIISVADELVVCMTCFVDVEPSKVWIVMGEA